MQNLMAALALCVAGLIIWWSLWPVIARHRPVMAARGRRQDDPVEAPAMPGPTPWFAPPSNPLLDLKAARIRTEPVAQIGRRAGWNAEDDAELLRLLADDLPTEAIAAKLGRSEKSVLLRIPLLRLRQRQTEQMERTAQAG